MKLRFVLVLVLFMALCTECASNKNKQEVKVDMEGFKKPTPIAVGTIHAALSFQQVNDHVLTAEVVEVLAYGASTPRLKSGQNLNFHFQDVHADYIKTLDQGSIFNAVISKSPAGINSESDQWNIIEFLETNQNTKK